MTHNVPNRNWSYPTAIKFGVGRISELAGHCMASGITNPLLVTDRALAALPITAEAVAVLKAAGLGEEERVAQGLGELAERLRGSKASTMVRR